jgi:TolB-like protein
LENETMSDTSFSENPHPPLPVNPEPSQPPSIKRRQFPFLLVGSHLLAFVVGFMLACGVAGWKSRPARSIAVMPFSGDWRPPGAKDREGWAEKSRFFIEVSLPDSIVKDVVTRAPPGKVKVIATHEVRQRKLPEKSPQQIGKDLEVSAVLSGNVSPDGGLTLQLIAVKSGELLWSNTYSLGLDKLDDPRGLDPNAHAEIAGKVIHNLTSRDF